MNSPTGIIQAVRVLTLQLGDNLNMKPLQNVPKLDQQRAPTMKNLPCHPLMFVF